MQEIIETGSAHLTIPKGHKVVLAVGHITDLVTGQGGGHEIGPRKRSSTDLMGAIVHMIQRGLLMKKRTIRIPWMIFESELIKTNSGKLQCKYNKYQSFDITRPKKMKMFCRCFLPFLYIYKKTVSCYLC